MLALKERINTLELSIESLQKDIQFLIDETHSLEFNATALKNDVEWMVNRLLTMDYFIANTLGNPKEKDIQKLKDFYNQNLAIKWEKTK